MNTQPKPQAAHGPVSDLTGLLGIPNDVDLELFLACLEDAFRPSMKMDGTVVGSRMDSIDKFFGA